MVKRKTYESLKIASLNISAAFVSAMGCKLLFTVVRPPHKDNKIIPYYINQEVMKRNNNFRAQYKGKEKPTK